MASQSHNGNTADVHADVDAYVASVSCRMRMQTHDADAYADAYVYADVGTDVDVVVDDDAHIDEDDDN